MTSVPDLPLCTTTCCGLRATYSFLRTTYYILFRTYYYCYCYCCYYYDNYYDDNYYYDDYYPTDCFSGLRSLPPIIPWESLAFLGNRYPFKALGLACSPFRLTSFNI